MDVIKKYKNKLFEMSNEQLYKEWDDVMSTLRNKLNVKEKVEKTKFTRKTSSGMTYR